MAESQEDKDVDALISQLQSTLDKLKAAQRKDVADEEDEYDEPNDLSGAEKKARRVMRASRQQPSDTKSDS
jgi:hypothetical protein